MPYTVLIAYDGQDIEMTVPTLEAALEMIEAVKATGVEASIIRSTEAPLAPGDDLEDGDARG